MVGEAFAAWELQRKPQPLFIDRKRSERVAIWFAWRGRPLRTSYFNETLIPLLCRKAGMPLADARGRITSHRARATIASQLYNAKEPMTLFELQAWLGHRSPETTQHYAPITPTTFAKAYSDAGYFARNEPPSPMAPMPSATYWNDLPTCRLRPARRRASWRAEPRLFLLSQSEMGWQNND